MKNRIFILLLIIIMILGLYAVGKFFLLQSDKPPETYISEVKDIVDPPQEEIVSEGEVATGEEAIPSKVLIDVPFTSQAPFAVWDERHEEACEEAALIIIKAYLRGEKLTKEKSEEEIQKLIEFQIKNYGDYKDSDAEQIVRLAEDYYGIDNLDIVYDFKRDRIKKELAKENPIIIPAAGRELGNPYFTPPGPLYHNLVLVGYSGDQIITNDPGTRRGEKYRYDIDVLYNAIHDFPGSKERIKEGRKAMIVIR